MSINNLRELEKKFITGINCRIRELEALQHKYYLIKGNLNLNHSNLLII